MSCISTVNPETANAAQTKLFDAVQKQVGFVPNLMKTLGHSPSALEGYLSLNGSLAAGVLSPQLRERIALFVAEYNGCEYCLAAHTYLGRQVAKLSANEVGAAREGHSEEAQAAAALQFARHVIESKGRITDVVLNHIRAAGFEDAAIIEIVNHVALNILTNYTNNVAQTVVDFPAI
ncbi:MAG: carboxymuconolactone decarboxylase family protein [Candidatus Saccharibacteria bacterium]|nr:carboxymuconolactone decarboxylase family protein [Moraxellaceae bacterium]